MTGSGFLNQCRDIGNPGVERYGVTQMLDEAYLAKKFFYIAWCLKTKLGAFCGGTVGSGPGKLVFPSACLQEDQLKFHGSAMQILQTTAFNCPRLLFTLCG